MLHKITPQSNCEGHGEGDKEEQEEYNASGMMDEWISKR